MPYLTELLVWAQIGVVVVAAVLALGLVGRPTLVRIRHDEDDHEMRRRHHR